LTGLPRWLVECGFRMVEDVFQPLKPRKCC
jgi:hypothetical protein